MSNILNKAINLSKEWHVHQNNLADLEPDNDFPIDDVFIHFSDDLCQFTYQDYLMDIGYYGEYLHEREGGYTVFIAKGDFNSGEVYEKIRTRSLQNVVDCIEKYGKLIVSGEVEKLTALPFKYGEIPIYSACRFIHEFNKQYFYTKKSIEQQCQWLLTQSLNNTSKELEELCQIILNTSDNVQLRKSCIKAINNSFDVNLSFLHQATLEIIRTIDNTDIETEIAELIVSVETLYQEKVIRIVKK